MARKNKALQQNKEFGEDRPGHRDHRSKKNRKQWKREGLPEFFRKRREYREKEPNYWAPG